MKGRGRSGRWIPPLLVLIGSGFLLAAGPGEPSQDSTRGKELFERHCAVCHGPEGRGDGQAAYLLYPAPRNFTTGRFRLVSTDNGVPTPADLIATIKRGMPGSAMPPWGWLAEEDLWNLASYVRHLAVEGIKKDLLELAREEDEDLTEEEALEIAADRMQPGKPVDVGPALQPNPVIIEEGHRLYNSLCASCHGAKGTGVVSQKLFNQDGTPTTARDFTAGIFKGGATHTEIARRILAGLSGSPMPAVQLDNTRQAGLLAAFVRSLAKPGAEERVVQRRHTVMVHRVDKVPLDPGDPAWEGARGTWIALMPLWWRNDRIEGVTVRAIHDGSRIAFRITWCDATENEDLLRQTGFSDGAALELSTQKDPPLFAMGASGQPVDIVLWRAAWEKDMQLARGVADRFPDMEEDSFLPRLKDLHGLTLTARQAGNSQAVPRRAAPSEDLVAQGFGTVGPRPDGSQSWSSRGRWENGFWDVVYVRPLERAGNPLSPGAHAFMAFAVWDGAKHDRNGQKSVSVWHRLEIER